MKARFSTIDTVSCNDCSAIYSIGQVRDISNLQRLLDLKARFSTIDTDSCNDCSAIYSIGQVRDIYLTYRDC